MRKRLRFAAVVALLTLLLAPVPAVAREARSAPVTVPALTDWTPESGSYVFGTGTRLVADGTADRRVAETLAGDLRAAGHGTPAVVRGGARPGDIVIDVKPSKSSLGAEGYELRVGRSLSITGATETGAFYGTRTLLQLLAQGDRIPAGRTVDVPRYKERGVGVCACYIHITLPWLENLVREMSYNKLNQLLVELKVRSDAHPEANTWGYYTKDEIRRLVALGDKYHVEIIPEINSPGHIDPWIENRPDLQLTDSDGNKQPSRLDITRQASFDYYKSLMDEYAEVFTSKSWHMGADEYMLGSDFAKYPQILKYAQERYGPNATPQDAFVDFVNRVHDYAAGKGVRLRIWNDGLTGANTVPVAKDTTVEHWLNVAVKPSQLIAQGYSVMNSAYSLYLIRGGFHSDTASLYDQKWDPRSFEGEQLTSSKGVTGAKISLWPDNGRGETENEVAVRLWPALRHIAQATRGDPHPDATYDAFTARGTAIGHAPGWRDLTRVPVADGTYRFGQSFTAAVQRTADGYATLRSAAGCLAISGGRLTLNVPLQPGVEATWDTCDATNTVQRWELEPAAGGYRLVNAITQMALAVTDDGRIAQYPADQHTPTVWHLS
ncbi:family 20 glycosylhydrolase [Streptomyces griseorubiginosus]|uniref:family 20 glycosylhydrolase n=1 Tax=Streptomyces griseorubiginosus TaxID=67304 RepID=UPI002E813BC8|nr:family 20 glycosylhydrolase [Streptomyces griseorubiginosus]WUB42759.1 family 20 glycosylhydrolase [Streptomyces griseorubiginosus]WUB51278.1 family 20 glycosylhydrolase [Streptomyces griseorubiginosus]